MVKRVLLSIGLLVSSASFATAAKNSVPAGSVLHCRLTETLSTFMNSEGDAFTANVSEPVMIDGREVIPAGAKIEGRISQLQRPGRIRGVGEMRLTAEKVVLPDGATYPLSAILAAVYGAEAKVHGEEGQVKGPNSRRRTVEEVGAGMGGGGLIGTIFGGFTGTLVGGAIGGAAGFVDTMRKRGSDLALPTGTQLNYQLTRDLDVEAEIATERINKTERDVAEKPVKEN
jgi:hypothetical protein